ncbi:tRNA/tmRNA/rRNA uracil-C5-methylase (TrmA/RlmC/RlmD family) [Microbacterium ginsengiterrae]|uniref:tRNA/tmRNA/rRNA uracil-C5-methylase (TrmA/RlmC/RlmD family) n=1 Tax=Microbacterium ginsengiterrae TaxID=546115 RepID=A0A7W9FA67_9MICO|nr:TRAM domain-containing protein [Microbacterium ginsengiterrae]MBB5741790.1 tRNA/tmRNA/rRNA uracil-C5-methylase (TrmA/RlmC/RlmD family) [Microbacterium ginsengiterrae]
MARSASDLLDLDVTGIAHGGTFIARHEGRVVFVSDAIPGERVRARITDDTKASFWRAETVEVVEASPHRRPHVWAEADVSRDPEERAGGADLGHIDLAHQRSLKQQVLREALDKFAGAGLDAPTVEAVDDTDGTGWRTRISLHVDDDGVIGPYAARSHRVIPVASHALARPRVEAEALALKKGDAGRIDLVESADGDVHVLRRPKRAKRRPAPRVLTERVGGRTFRVDADGFWQVHPAAAATLDAAVRSALDGRVDASATHLDLYGGVGLLASSLASAGASDIVTVESSARATAHARENLADVDVTAVTARVDRYLAGLGDDARAGTVVLDPPRSGAGRAVVDGVHALAPDAVVYVACDPVALARDLGTFRGLGWKVEAMCAFDLFPHSHHFEVVATLIR